jgi:hypothetical protein
MEALALFLSSELGHPKFLKPTRIVYLKNIFSKKAVYANLEALTFAWVSQSEVRRG